MIADQLALRGDEIVADIGGGQGGLLAALLGKHPQLSAWLFDQPQVLEDPTALVSANLLSRCRLLAGDFFVEVPTGADVYLLKRIVHDWTDEEALSILRNCRDAMPPSGRLVLIEAVMQPGNAPDPNKALDVSIMVLTHGRERTAAEFSALLEQAGFALSQVTALREPASLSLVEAVPSSLPGA